MLGKYEYDLSEDWLHPVQDMDQWLALVNDEINLRVI
jgi:hypothetical protein